MLKNMKVEIESGMCFFCRFAEVRRLNPVRICFLMLYILPPVNIREIPHVMKCRNHIPAEVIPSNYPKQETK